MGKKTFKTKFINFIIFIILIALGLFLYSKYLGVKGLIVKEYKVESNILTKNFSGIKIIHISDILYGSTVDNDDINDLVKKVNELKPDIIVFTGDLVSTSKKLSESETEFLETSLESMEATIGKYAIKGDYDYKLSSYETIMNNGKFTLLSNSYEEIFYKDDRSIYIVGLPSMTKDTIDLSKSFEFYKDENRKYTIVLIHEGNTISKLDSSDYEVDLILGGHSLNGSVIVPYYGSIFIPKESSKYYAPTYEKGITKIFISSGIGTLNNPYRFMNKPSFNLIRLKSL